MHLLGGAAQQLRAVDLPVEGRKRTGFVIHCRNAPDGMPLTTDTTGVWIRPEGQYHICGWSPPEAEDRTADPDDFEPDHDTFDEMIWPANTNMTALPMPKRGPTQVIESR